MFQSQSKQVFVPLIGKISTDSYQQTCKEHGIDPHQTVFIFPGNPTHHTASDNLYSVKSGLGLGVLTQELGGLGLPVLSIPTTGMKIINTGEAIPALSIRAIEDIWMAIGYGMNIVLPVRKPGTIVKDEFFNRKFKDGTEPSFWGTTEKKPNTELAEYYLKQLEIIQGFLNGEILKPPTEFQEAFAYGQQKKNETPLKPSTLNDWFKRNIKPTVQSQEKILKTPTQKDHISLSGSDVEMDQLTDKKREVKSSIDQTRTQTSKGVLGTHQHKITDVFAKFVTGLDITSLPGEKQNDLLQLAKLIGVNVNKLKLNEPRELTKREKMINKLFETNFGLPKGKEATGGIAFNLLTNEDGSLSVKSVVARGTTEISSDARHTTPISWVGKMLTKVIEDLHLNTDETAKLVLLRLENLITDIAINDSTRTITSENIFNAGSKKLLEEDAQLEEEAKLEKKYPYKRIFASINSMTREEIISAFHEYYQLNIVNARDPVQAKQALSKMAEVMFRMYSRRPYVSFPSQGNTEAISGEGKEVGDSGELLYAIHSEIVETGKVDQDKYIKLIDILYEVFDFKPLPSDEQGRKAKREEVYKYLASIQKGTVKNQLPLAYQKEFSEYLKKHQVEQNVSTSAYTNAIKHYWRLNPKNDLTLLPLLIARHLDDAFLLAPALQEDFQQKVIKDFIAKIGAAYEMNESDVENLNNEVNKILNNRYHYFYDFDVSQENSITEQAFYHEDKPYSEYILELSEMVYQQLMTGNFEKDSELGILFSGVELIETTTIEEQWQKLIKLCNGDFDVLINNIVKDNCDKHMALACGSYLDKNEIEILLTYSDDQLRDYDDQKLLRARNIYRGMYTNIKEKLVSSVNEMNDEEKLQYLQDRFIEFQQINHLADYAVLKANEQYSDKSTAMNKFQKMIRKFYNQYDQNEHIEEIISIYAEIISKQIYEHKTSIDHIIQAEGFELDLQQLCNEISILIESRSNDMSNDDEDVMEYDPKTLLDDKIASKLLDLINDDNSQKAIHSLYIAIIYNADEDELSNQYQQLLDRKSEIYWLKYFKMHMPLTTEKIQSLELPLELDGLDLKQLIDDETSDRHIENEQMIVDGRSNDTNDDNSNDDDDDDDDDYDDDDYDDDDYDDDDDDDDEEDSIQKDRITNLLKDHFRNQILSENLRETTLALYLSLTVNESDKINIPIEDQPNVVLDDNSNISNQLTHLEYQLQSHDINAVCTELLKDQPNIHYLPVQQDEGPLVMSLANSVDSSLIALSEGKRIASILNVGGNHWVAFMLTITNDCLYVHYKDSLGGNIPTALNNYINQLQNNLNLTQINIVGRTREQIDNQLDTQLLKVQSLVFCGVFAVENMMNMVNLSNDQMVKNVSPQYFNPLNTDSVDDRTRDQIYIDNINISREKLAALYLQNAEAEEQRNQLKHFLVKQATLILFNELPNDIKLAVEFDRDNLSNTDEKNILTALQNYLAEKLNINIIELDVCSDLDNSDKFWVRFKLNEMEQATLIENLSRNQIDFNISDKLIVVNLSVIQQYIKYADSLPVLEQSPNDEIHPVDDRPSLFAQMSSSSDKREITPLRLDSQKSLTAFDKDLSSSNDDLSENNRNDDDTMKKKGTKRTAGGERKDQESYEFVVGKKSDSKQKSKINLDQLVSHQQSLVLKYEAISQQISKIQSALKAGKIQEETAQFQLRLLQNQKSQIAKQLKAIPDTLHNRVKRIKEDTQLTESSTVNPTGLQNPKKI